MRRVLASVLFLALVFVPSPAFAQSPFLAPYSDPEQEFFTEPSLNPTVLTVRIDFGSTGHDTVEIEGVLDSGTDDFSLGRNVADALNLPRDSYDVLYPGDEVESFEEAFGEGFAEGSGVDVVPQITLDSSERLAERRGEAWIYELDTEDLQRVSVQNGFSILAVELCPATESFDVGASSQRPDGSADCQYWTLDADADPISISLTETPDVDDFWNLTLAQAITGFVFFLIGILCLFAARAAGHLKTLNGASLGWIIGLSLTTLFVWLVSTIVMGVNYEAVNEYVFARGLGNGGQVLSFALPALLPASGILLVIIALCLGRPHVRGESAPTAEPHRGTGGPTPAWMNAPAPQTAPAAPAPSAPVPAPPVPAPPAPSEPAPSEPVVEPEQVELEAPTDEPRKEDPPSWNPPS